jgi:hypothetical protein
MGAVVRLPSMLALSKLLSLVLGWPTNNGVSDTTRILRPVKDSASAERGIADSVRTIEGSGAPRTRGPVQQAVARILEDVSARPEPVFVVSDAPLPDGGVGRVYLGQRTAPHRFFLVHAREFSDEIRRQLRVLAFSWQVRHPDEVGPSVITLFPDGHWESDSPSGKRSAQLTAGGTGGGKPDEYQLILRALEKAKPVELPGIGLVRIVEP